MIDTAGASAPHVQSVREDFSGRDLARMTPLINVLSNGSLTVVSTSTGASRMLHDGFPVTHWEAVETASLGRRTFVRDAESGRMWSVDGDGDHPDDVLVSFDAGLTETSRTAEGIETTTSIIVLSDSDVEARRIRIRNTSPSPRSLELLSILDLSGGGDEVLPTSGYDAPSGFLLIGQTGARRVSIETRGPGSAQTFVISTADVMDVTSSSFDWIGRGSSRRSSSERTSLASLHRITLRSLEDVQIYLFTHVSAENSAEPLLPVGSSVDFDGEIRNSAGREVERMLMHHVRPDHVRYFRRLGGAVAFDLPQFRAPADLVRRLRVPIHQIERHGLQVGRPAMVARVADETEMKLVRCLLTAHRYWRSSAIPIDLMFLNDRSETESAEKLQMAIENEAAEFDAALYERGGVLSEYADDILHEDQVAIQAYASFLAPGELPHIADFHYTDIEEASDRYVEAAAGASRRRSTPYLRTSFFHDNVEVGAAGEMNGDDPTWEHGTEEKEGLRDAPVQASQLFFLRNETERSYQALSPVLNRTAEPHDDGGSIRSDLSAVANPDQSVQVARLTLHNLHSEDRMVSAFVMWDITFGANKALNRHFSCATWLPRDKALLMYNGVEEELREGGIFVAVRSDRAEVMYSSDRVAFVGRNGSTHHPLLVRSGRDLDNTAEDCGASALLLQARIELRAGESTAIDFITGRAASQREVRRQIKAADPSRLFESV